MHSRCKCKFLLQGDESHAYLDQQLCCQHRRWVVCAPCLHWPDISRICAMDDLPHGLNVGLLGRSGLETVRLHT